MPNKLNHQNIPQDANPLNTNAELIETLELRIKKLGDICNELNPYQPIPSEFKLRLREFNILEVEDPFKITNALLMLLEDAIDELHIYKPLSDAEMLIENLK